MYWNESANADPPVPIAQFVVQTLFACLVAAVVVNLPKIARRVAVSAIVLAILQCLDPNCSFAHYRELVKPKVAQSVRRLDRRAAAQRRSSRWWFDEKATADHPRAIRLRLALRSARHRYRALSSRLSVSALRPRHNGSRWASCGHYAAHDSSWPRARPQPGSAPGGHALRMAGLPRVDAKAE